jgi:hypothetical protein
VRPLDLHCEGMLLEIQLRQISTLDTTVESYFLTSSDVPDAGPKTVKAFI